MRFNTRTLAGVVLALIVTVIAWVMLNQPDDTTTPDAITVNANGIGALFDGLRFDDVASWRVVDVINERDNRFVRTENGRWQVAETFLPAGAQLAQNTIDEALADLINASSSASFESDDLTPFGLIPANYQLALTLNDATTITLLLGTLNPAGTRYYGQVIRPADDATPVANTIYLINNPSQIARITALAVDLPLLLPPTSVPAPALQIPGVIFGGYDVDTIDRFSWQAHDGAILIGERQDDTWRINGQAGDEARIQLLLAGWSGLRASDAITLETNTDQRLQALGLTSPSYTLETARTLTGIDGQPATNIDTLAIGALDASETRYYVLSNRTRDILLMPREEIDILLDAITNPPLLANIEATPEVTPEATP